MLPKTRQKWNNISYGYGNNNGISSLSIILVLGCDRDEIANAPCK